MALTPEDVVNKRFNPTKFREGYDQDEVDDFLDEVVVELRRLGQENEELRQRLAQSESHVAELQRAGASAAPAAAPAPAPMPAPAPAPAMAGGAEDPSNTNNLLQLARRLHEEHVREGVEKRDALIAEGHAAAARIVQEAESQNRERIGGLERERAALESQVEELRSFEREYREKLRDYIQGQLRDLETSRPVGIGQREAQPSLPQQPSQQAQPPAMPAPEPAAAYPSGGQGGEYASFPQPPQYPGFGGN
ncbi:MAG: DivIVA domain-containing protein [Actinomycetales bacterium]|nr:DivIVA domain-containing protein [Actinomycetales bacterium]